jgi:hypothetical protein
LSGIGGRRGTISDHLQRREAATLRCLPEKDGDLAEVKVDEVFGLCHVSHTLWGARGVLYARNSAHVVTAHYYG